MRETLDVLTLTQCKTRRSRCWVHRRELDENLEVADSVKGINEKTQRKDIE